MKLKLDFDFNGEAYMTVSGQNSNNSVRVNNQERFLEGCRRRMADWKLIRRTDGREDQQDDQGAGAVGPGGLCGVAVRGPGRAVR